MNKLFVCALAGLLAAGLAGCGKQEKKKQDAAVKLPIEIKDEGVSATLGGGKLPKDAPAYVALYPDADVMAVVKNVGGPGTATMVTFSSKHKTDAIVGFYTKLGEKFGMEVVSDQVSYGTRHVRMKKEGQIISLAVNERMHGDTMVELTYR